MTFIYKTNYIMVKQRRVSSFEPYNWFYYINVMFPTIFNPNLNFSDREDWAERCGYGRERLILSPNLARHRRAVRPKHWSFISESSRRARHFKVSHDLLCKTSVTRCFKKYMMVTLVRPWSRRSDQSGRLKLDGRILLRVGCCCYHTRSFVRYSKGDCKGDPTVAPR